MPWSAITHAHVLGQDGSALIAVAAHSTFSATGADAEPHTILASCAAELATPTFRNAAEVVANTLEFSDPVGVAQLTGSGIAAHEAAPAALAAFLHHPTDPVTAISFAIAMGNDTDTVAAMAGSLAGALAGEERLPERLLRRLERRDHITQVADALADRTYAWRSA